MEEVSLNLCSNQRNAKKSRLNESTLFNRIHKHSFGGLGADTLTFCESPPLAFKFVGDTWIFVPMAVGFFKGWTEVPHSVCKAASVSIWEICTLIVQKSRVYPPLFPQKVNSFWKIFSYSMNTIVYPRKELTRKKVDTVGIAGIIL